jgi:hypothetical protein
VSTHDVTLLTSIVEHHEPSGTPGIQVTSYSMSGEPHAAAIVDAVAADYHRVTGRPPVTDNHLAELVDQRVTLLRVGKNMLGVGALVASPGTIFQGSGLALRPKGKQRHGYRTEAGSVLDLQPGYAGVQVLRRRVAAVRVTLPQLTKLTHERLARLPSAGGDCTLAVFGTWQLPDVTSAGAIWLLRSYPRGDIAEGLLAVRPEHGVSEHGSILGQELLHFGGEIVGAPVIPLREALAMADDDYVTVLARFARSQP